MNNATSSPPAARGPADHDVRAQIVVAATEHFSQYGYEKTTVSDLAKAIGFSKAYIYKFFESKQAIGEMICANCLREIQVDIRAAVDAAESPPEKLRRMFKAIDFSKAYIYKFFESKQAIGEMICSNCLREIEVDIRAAVDAADRPPEKLRRMFKAIVDSGLRLFFQDRKLYEIAISAASERWPSAIAHEQCIRQLIVELLRLGRESGDFERKTPIDETAAAIYLVVYPYVNPVILQLSSDHTEQAPAQLSGLVLRSLSP